MSKENVNPIAMMVERRVHLLNGELCKGLAYNREFVNAMSNVSCMLWCSVYTVL